MARVLVYTSPARGHLYPLVPILDELAARGHEVRSLSRHGASGPALGAVPSGVSHLRGDFVDAQASSDRVGNQLAVTGDHRHLDPHRVELLDRLRRLRPDFILDGKGAEELAIGDHMEDRPTIAAPRLGCRVRLDAQVGEEARSTDSDYLAIHRGPSTAAGERLETG